MTYYFLPNDGFFARTFKKPMAFKPTSIDYVESEDKSPMLTFTFEHNKEVKAAVYCAKGKERDCEATFTAIVQLFTSLQAWKDCMEEMGKPLIERTADIVKLHGQGKSKTKLNSILLCNLSWAMKKNKDVKDSTVIPEDYRNVLPDLYKKYKGGIFSKLVHRLGNWNVKRKARNEANKANRPKGYLMPKWQEDLNDFLESYGL